MTLASGKTVNRVQIREELRPRWQPIDEWHESREFAQMQQAHESSVANERARQAEQVVRISSGPARMIGKPVTARFKQTFVTRTQPLRNRQSSTVAIELTREP